MQEELRLAIARLLPDKRRAHRQGWQRPQIVKGRTPACRLLEQVIDEAIRDGVRDVDVEMVGLTICDWIRRKLDARRARPLGVPSLGIAIRDEEQVQGEMAGIQIEQLQAPTSGGLQLLKWYYQRHGARIRDCLRVIDRVLQSEGAR